jgi:hypothetical protein
MRYTTEDERFSFTFDRTDEGGPVVVQLADAEADVTVELTLGDWLPGRDRPEITAVTIRKQRGVTTRDVRLPVSTYAGVVGSAFAALRGLDQNPRARWSTARLGDDFLRDVADAYRAAPEGGRIAAVRQVRDASKSQVLRWVRAARERGFLEPRD